MLDRDRHCPSPPCHSPPTAPRRPQLAKLLADVDRIKAGPAPTPRATVLEEVAGAPGWVRVAAAPGGGPAPPPPPPPYFWNLGTGQVSWASPQGQDALKSLDMTRAVVSDAAGALAAGVPASAPSARRAAAAEALARLLDALGAEQRRRALEQMGTPGSRVWCAVHSCLTAAVAALSAEAADPGPTAQLQQPEVQPPRAEEAIASMAPGDGGQRPAAVEEEREEPAAKKRKATAKPPSTVAAKGAASLMNRWAARQQEMAAAEGGGEEAAAEEWRADQVRAGAAAVNSNFAPVFGDWRDRVRAQQQRRTPAAAAAPAHPAQPAAAPAPEHPFPTAAVPTPTAPAVPDLAAASAGLPPGWTAMWDPASGGVYYGNLTTSQTQWHRPQHA